MNNFNYNKKLINRVSNSFFKQDILNITMLIILCLIILFFLTFNKKNKIKEVSNYENNNSIIKKKLNYILNSSIKELKKKNS